MVNIAHKIKDIASEVGFVEVCEKAKKLPWAPWATDEKLKELGRYALLNCETSFEAFGLALFTRVLGLSKEEAIRVCSESRKELRNKKIHVYNLQYAIPPHLAAPTHILWTVLTVVRIQLFRYCSEAANHEKTLVIG